MTEAEIRALLNAPAASERLANLAKLLDAEQSPPRMRRELSNNHIHTTYSFSPYSPTAAVWFARQSGLPVAGIMDHDSMGGAAEFRAAAKLAKVGATCGFEARINYAGTGFDHVRLNNPDQDGVGYMTFHSVRSRYFTQVQDFLAPLRQKRNDRNRAMVANINRVTGQDLDFERDVLPLSNAADGGSVTERHLLFALTYKLLPDGGELERYQLLGKLKSDLVPRIFIPATDELMDLTTAVGFAREIDAILCYAYLGDVTASPTGDKKAAKYEDSFLPELVALLKARGVNAITFMPSRNTEAQLTRVMDLCRENGLLQISGEDVNALGQSFICEKLTQERYQHLVSAAWALVKREEE
ncbi:MAG: PHP domain-containing protein [Oscillospiraceae bacterium]|nr:PHP domain-containing protein [Oscillospiraceae bacterium]